jgi:hypothetical protein
MGAWWLKTAVLLFAKTVLLKQILYPSLLKLYLFLHLEDFLRISSRKGNLAVGFVSIIAHSIVSVQEIVHLKRF